MAPEPEVLPDEEADPEGEPGGEEVGVADEEGAKAGLLGGDEEGLRGAAGERWAEEEGFALWLDAEGEELREILVTVDEDGLAVFAEAGEGAAGGGAAFGVAEGEIEAGAVVLGMPRCP